jgi:AcrR family transcriptional regulator
MVAIQPVNIDVITTQYEVTDAGCKLLDVMIDPVARTMSVIDICAVAGISKGSYYLLFKDKRFLDAYYQACKTACITAAMPTMQSVAGRAIAGDMQAAQLILQMTGLHQPTTRVDHVHEHDIGPTLREILARRK